MRVNGAEPHVRPAPCASGQEQHSSAQPAAFIACAHAVLAPGLPHATSSAWTQSSVQSDELKQQVLHALGVDHLPIDSDVAPAIVGFMTVANTKARAVMIPVYGR